MLDVSQRVFFVSCMFVLREEIWFILYIPEGPSDTQISAQWGFDT